MITVEVKISEKVLGDLRQALTVRAMSGMGGDLIDTVAAKLLEGAEAGEDVTLAYKSERDSCQEESGNSGESRTRAH